MLKYLKFFVGYDGREDLAYQVCRHSILLHSPNVEVTPIIQDVLRAQRLYTRPRDKLAATDFSITRFMVPLLAGFRGYSIFSDCDFIFTRDVEQFLDYIDPTKAVSVVKHDYTPHFDVKMDGKKQYNYPKKNWSSLIVFNNQHPDTQNLTLDVINRETPSYFHQFKWTSEENIGELPKEANWLVGEYGMAPELPWGIHYTNGIPFVHEELPTTDYVETFKFYMNTMS